MTDAQSDAEPGSPWALISRYESTAKRLREEPTLLSNEEKIEWMEEFCEELRAALAQSDAEPSLNEDAVNEAFDKFMEGQEYKQSGNHRLFFHAGVEFGLRHAQSDAEPVAWQDTDLAGINITGLDGPPRPDASAGLIEAAEIADKSAKYHQQQYNLVNTVKQQLISSSKAMVAEEIAKNIRARVVNRNAK